MQLGQPYRAFSKGFLLIQSALAYGGARKLTGENLEAAWAEFSSLS